MKRAFINVADNTRSKKPRLENSFIFKKKNRIMVSATHVYSYMMRDSLVDWLKLSSRCGTRKSPAYTKAGGFTEFIMNKGVEFECELIKYINNNRVPVISVSEYITPDSLRKTKELMKQGVPIIHSAPVKNPYNNTQGIIDLLVRSDYIANLVDEDPLTKDEKTISAPKLDESYHYIVIDIKFSTLPLRSDGLHLLNSGSYPAYKAQCLIYTEAVGYIQGYTAPYAFIMGRRWRYTKGGVINRNYTCLNKLGKISYNSVDSDYNIRTKDAIKWVRDVKRNGKTWKVNPPSRVELYPNMCIDSGEWNSEKKKIADNIGEMTSIWYVGMKHRNIAIDRGIKSWRDKRCTAKAMGLNGVRAPIIDSIMGINRQTKDKIWPSVIKNNMYNWKKKGCELFVDFETISDIFADFNHLPNQYSTDMIFMIGVGWVEKGKWTFINFICNEATYDEEYRIMNEFAQFVTDRDNPKMYNWVAESQIWNSAECRQFDIACDKQDEELKNHISDWQIDNWADLHNVFKTEPIVLKDCYKFGLKPIAKAMRKHKMISANIESECNNGMTAMVNAWNCYKKSNNPATSDMMKDIAKYNEFDCKVLWEILSYLRENHVE